MEEKRDTSHIIIAIKRGQPDKFGSKAESHMQGENQKKQRRNWQNHNNYCRAKD
jgi:hypothetical protein